MGRLAGGPQGNWLEVLLPRSAQALSIYLPPGTPRSSTMEALQPSLWGALRPSAEHSLGGLGTRTRSRREGEGWRLLAGITSLARVQTSQGDVVPQPLTTALPGRVALAAAAHAGGFTLPGWMGTDRSPEAPHRKPHQLSLRNPKCQWSTAWNAHMTGYLLRGLQAEPGCWSLQET